jgi:hypothetical protein
MQSPVGRRTAIGASPLRIGARLVCGRVRRRDRRAGRRHMDEEISCGEDTRLVATNQSTDSASPASASAHRHPLSTICSHSASTLTRNPHRDTIRRDSDVAHSVYFSVRISRTTLSSSRWTDLAAAAEGAAEAGVAVAAALARTRNSAVVAAAIAAAAVSAAGGAEAVAVAAAVAAAALVVPRSRTRPRAKFTRSRERIRRSSRVPARPAATLVAEAAASSSSSSPPRPLPVQPSR